MKRSALVVALGVFVIETLAEFILISTIPGHFKTWYALPDRHFILAARILMNVAVAIAAGWLVDYAQRKSELIREREERRKSQEAFLNHHVRNALSALQYAAYLTHDKQVVEHCDAAIARIVWALSHANQVEDNTYGAWLSEWKTNLESAEPPASSHESTGR